MSAHHLCRHQGARGLLHYLMQPSFPAALTSTSQRLFEKFDATDEAAAAAALLLFNSRQFSHYTASSSSSSSLHLPSSPIRDGRRKFSSAVASGSGSGGVASALVRQPKSKNSEVDGSEPPLPGAALRRVAPSNDALNPKGAEKPPWQGASSEHLSNELHAYRKDLVLAKKATVR